MSSRIDWAAQYREAKAAVVAAVRAEVRAELAWMAAPHDDLLAAAHEAAHAHTLWCKSLVIACGEKHKGRPFAECVNERV